MIVVPGGTVVVSVVRTIVLRGRDCTRGGQDATWGRDRMQCEHQSHACLRCIYTLYIPPVGGVPMVGVLVV